MTQPIRARSQSGFTLIEVMISFVLLLVLMMGMNALWTQVSAQFDLTTYREKAILRLSGEMTRLVNLYTSAEYGFMDNYLTDTTAVDYTKNLPTDMGSYISISASSSTVPANGKRLIYALGDVKTPVYVGADAGTSLSQFIQTINPDGTSPSASTVYSYILVLGSGDATRNYVWLDNGASSIVAQLSWDMYQISSDSLPCYNGNGSVPGTGSDGRCYLLTVYIDYPFRFNRVDNTVSEIPGIPIDTVTAQTIVGKLFR
jgi:prepilin-type N-terminal cleavage/methylation domain-containing protein